MSESDIMNLYPINLSIYHEFTYPYNLQYEYDILSDREIDIYKTMTKQQLEEIYTTFDDKTKKYLEELKEKRDDKGEFYIYTRSRYPKNNGEKILIICRIHGKFLQKAKPHKLSNCRCYKCSKISMGNKQRLNTTEFIRRASLLYCNRFDYSRTKYIDSYTEVEICCNKHGIYFWRNPFGHLRLNRNQGCVECAKENIREANIISLDKRIEKFKLQYETQYDYSHITREDIDNYKDNKGIIKVFCLKCKNFFTIVINSHDRGIGCNICRNKTELKVYEFLLSQNFDLISQAKFEWCRNIKYLPFDFVINKFIIELDGDQHFKDMDFWNSSFDDVSKRDVYKMKCALENGYKIIRIVQKDVWSDKYDWKEKLLKTLNNKKLKYDLCYISYNKDVYKNHIDMITAIPNKYYTLIELYMDEI